MIHPTNWKPTVFFVVYLLSATFAPAQILTTLFDFDGADGVAPKYALLTQGTDGNFYGTTIAGGNGGVVFQFTPSGAETVLYSFCSLPNCTDGANPWAGLVEGSDGNFYGTTFLGGAFGYGTIFKVTPGGVLTTLYSFCASGLPCVDGAYPTSPLVQGIDGNFYGTTGGDLAGNVKGTVFKITPTGMLTTLYNFCAQSGCPDGVYPFAGLVQASDGNFYGTTAGGGTGGTVFRITPTGTLTTIYDFCTQSNCTDGTQPMGTLVVGPDGNFYGTTQLGGSTKKLDGQGTVFKITPTGKLTTLYRFCEQPIGSFCPDSGLPLVGLTLVSNGYFAGTTSLHPTIFGISPKGKFVQYTKANNTPAGLLQGTNALLYGMASGGTFNEGTIFSLDVGLAPFIKTMPEFGPANTSVIILGTNLTGATRVTFNGTAANFTVVSASEITTNVPSGATTGKVKVTTPNGTLASNLPFAVK
jgi:uncharacterized repeat protein (TIGR03803 family)